MADVASVSQTSLPFSEMSYIHQLQRQNTHLLQTHKVYLSAMSQLEAQLSDCRTQLHLRDTELELLRSASLAGEWKADIAKIQALETRTLQLENENRSLRHSVALTTDIEKLKADLVQAVELRSSYVHIPGLEEDSSQEQVPEDVNTLAALQRANQTLYDELQTTIKELEKTKQERDFLRGEVIPVLEQAMKLYEIEKNELEKKLEESKSRGPSPVSRTGSPALNEMTSKTAFARSPQGMEVTSPQGGSRGKKSGSPKVTGFQTKSRPLPLRRPLAYAPSFLRSKVPPDKRMSLPHPQPAPREDHFADVFPEDNELV